jgi:hypothetical protein
MKKTGGRKSRETVSLSMVKPDTDVQTAVYPEHSLPEFSLYLSPWTIVSLSQCFVSGSAFNWSP